MSPILALVLGTAPTLLGAVHDEALADRDGRSCVLLDEKAGGGALVGTDGGLVRLRDDGKVIARVGTRDGLPGARVAALVSDGETTAWVGTEGGLAVVDLADDRLRVESTRPTVDDAGVRTLARAGDDVFVGTWGAGLQRWTPGTDALESIPFASDADGPSRRITDIEVAVDGTMTWVATAGGGIHELAHGKLVRSSVAPADGMVFSLAADPKQGRLWIGQLDGIHVTDNRGATTLWTRHDARSLAVTPNGIELAAVGAGILSVDSETGRLGRVNEGGPPSSALPRAMHVDGDRRCLATDDGVWLGDGDRWIHALGTGLPSGDIAAIAIDGDTRWVGTFDRGLARWNGEGWADIPGVPMEVNALAVVPGTPGVFVGTTRGLFHVHGKNAEMVDPFTTKSGLPSDKIQTLTTLERGRLLIGTGHGIRILDHGRIRTPAGARDWSVFAAAEAEDGTLWVGTTRGLVQLDGSGTWRHYSMLSGHLPDDWITSLRVQGDTLYVGTYGHGVVRMTGAGTKWRTTELGGGRVNIGGLELHDGLIYAATMDGLLTRPVGAAQSRQWVRFRDAGPGRDTTAVEVAPDGLWVATRRGLTRRAD